MSEDYKAAWMPHLRVGQEVQVDWDSGSNLGVGTVLENDNGTVTARWSSSGDIMQHTTGLAPLRTPRCGGCGFKLRPGDKWYEGVQSAVDLCGKCANGTTTEHVRLIGEVSA